MVEVFAKTPFGNFFFELFVGGGHHAHFDFYFFFAAHPRNAFFLQHAQHFGLRRQTHIADFVQKQGAAVGLFKAAFALFNRRGKRAFLVAEQFAFYKFGRNGGAVDRYPRAGRRSTALVNAVRQEFFARAVLALDKHLGRGGGHLIGHFQHRLQSRTLAHHFKFLHGGAFPAFGVLNKPLFVYRPAPRAQHPVQIQRLGQIVERAFFKAVHRRFYVAVARNHDKGHIARGGHGLFQYFHPVHARHFDIAKHRREGVFCQAFQGLPTIGRFHHLATFILENIAQTLSNQGFVVHHQNPTRCFCLVFHPS